LFFFYPALPFQLELLVLLEASLIGEGLFILSPVGGFLPEGAAEGVGFCLLV